MSRTKFKLIAIFALLTMLSGCRELSVFFDPGKNAPKKQLKVVKRDKPNLESDPGERPVDPDAADLVEATEEEAVEDGTLAQQIASGADVESGGDESNDIADLERKAMAIVGRWETTTVTDDFVAFEFSRPKAEGDTFVGTYTFFVNDTQDEPAKYVVSREDVIRFFSGGVENKTLQVSISADGQSLTFVGNKGITTKLVRAGSGPKQQPAKEPNVPVEDLPKPKATPNRPEIPDQ